MDLYLCKYSVLSVHNEDNTRVKPNNINNNSNDSDNSVSSVSNSVDIVFQNEYWVSCILEYI